MSYDEEGKGGLADAMQFVAERLNGSLVDLEQPAQVLVCHDNQTVHSVKRFLDDYLVHPERAQGFSTHAVVESFMAHVQRHLHLEHSVVFVNHETGAATAIYDYHAKGTTGQVIGTPAWAGHGARYAPQFSKQWLRWRAAEGKDMDMAGFAHRLEDSIFDVVAPGDSLQWDEKDERILAVAAALGGEPGSPSQLMTLSRNIEINAAVNVTEARRLSSGESQLVYAETHRDGTGAPVKVPAWFVISIPVFHGGGSELVPVRLRYRLTQGRLLWTYDLYRVEQVLLDAVMGIVESLVALPIPIYIGSPDPSRSLDD